ACDSWCEVDWSPDASQLVVADDSLSIVDVGTGVRTPLTSDPRDSSPVWSPTAPVIAFLRGSSLFTVHADSTRLTRLATFNTHLPAYSLTWSPDGESLLFARNDGIHTVRADGSGLELVRYVPGGVGVAHPSWSPDGRQIVYSITPGTYSEL